MFALVDCNNFYVSCERIFDPTILHKPVVVLSNNDGCVISRSNEAKKIGIKMGVPFFKIQNQVIKHNISVFSSNYTLYGDLSFRVFNTLKTEFSFDRSLIVIPVLGCSSMSSLIISLSNFFLFIAIFALF